MADRKIGYTQKMRTSGVVARTKVLVPIYLASYLALLCANLYRTNLFIVVNFFRHKMYLNGARHKFRMSLGPREIAQ